MTYLAGTIFVSILLLAPLIGLFTMPWSPFWFGQRMASSVPIDGVPFIPEVPRAGYFVSDADRYRLAVAAGFGGESITATAVSIAEDGSGDPAAISGSNFDGSRDLGLWQINSGWWPRFGGRAALVDPNNNARAARAIYLIQGWCAWSTYEPNCGPGHTGSYRAFIGRAQIAANRSGQ